MSGWESYIGFMMFSRTECGPDFVLAFDDGRLSWDMADEGAQYDNFYQYVRLGSPSARRSATLQVDKNLSHFSNKLIHIFENLVL